MISIIQEEIKPQNIKLSEKSKNLKLNPENFWDKSTSPIFHRIVRKFYDFIECDSSKFQKSDQQSDVNNAIRRLIHDGIIHQISSTKSGRPSKRKRDKKYFFTLTVVGIKILIDDLSEHPEKRNTKFFKDFWDSLSITLQKNNHVDFKELERLCEYYELKILKIKREHITPQFFNDAIKQFRSWENEVFWNKKYSEELFMEKEILKIIANRKTKLVSKSIFFQKFKNKKGINSILDEYLKKLTHDGIIKKTLYHKNNKYELTYLGLIKYFHFIYLDSKYFHFKNNASKIKSLLKNFEFLRGKYSYLLPKIFESQNYKDLKLSSFQFLQFFEYLYFNGEHPASILVIYDAYMDNLRFDNLRKFNDIRDNDFWHIFEKHIDSFTFADRYFQSMIDVDNNKSSRKVKESQYKMVTNHFPMDIVFLKQTIDSHWLKFNFLFLDHSYLPDIRNIKNFEKNEHFPQPKQHDKSIERKITFDFYSVYASIYGGLEKSNISSEVRHWYSNQVVELSDWLSEYSTILKN